MRLPIIVAATVALAVPAFAQQGRPRPPAPPPPQAQPQPPATQPGFFPCRTANEVCFIAIVMSSSKVAVVFTNHPQADAATAQPLDVRSVNGPLDLTPNIGRAVMLVGNYDGHGALTNAQVVDVASPLTSFALKNQASGDDQDSQDDTPPPAQGRPAPRR